MTLLKSLEGREGENGIDDLTSLYRYDSTIALSDCGISKANPKTGAGGLVEVLEVIDCATPKLQVVVVAASLCKSPANRLPLRHIFASGSNNYRFSGKIWG